MAESMRGINISLAEHSWVLILRALSELATLSPSVAYQASKLQGYIDAKLTLGRGQRKETMED